MSRLTPILGRRRARRARLRVLRAQLPLIGAAALMLAAGLLAMAGAELYHVAFALGASLAFGASDLARNL